MPSTITDASYELLDKVGSPLTPSQVVNRIAYLVTVKDADSVQASIYNDSRFVKFSSGKLALKKWLLNGVSFVLIPSLAQIKRGFININSYQYLFSQPEINLRYQEQNYNLKLKQNRLTGFLKLDDQFSLDCSNLLLEIIDLEQGDYILKEQNIGVVDTTVYKEIIIEVLEEKGVKRSENLLKEILVKAKDTGRLQQLLPLVPLEEVVKDMPQIYQPVKGLFKVNKFY
ncbi:winged helix-turn-helix domain-containing protein [Natroniella sulfidigena]|uniref:winged helix-turn-helix domain-containing protein n=1 Tax=Natroniella sulfidigena TaxID=723921 RepID=UPI00200A4464|nr:winged helix-turn-helix domain-containing protein [Natroniella sulfidigena]MCK8817673.1 winged helix-turn-helix domain-containing protein [Natroniella sulfidigena]